MVQRMYDPRARKGAWTKSEDADLIRYVVLSSFVLIDPRELCAVRQLTLHSEHTTYTPINGPRLRPSSTAPSKTVEIGTTRRSAIQKSAIQVRRGHPWRSMGGTDGPFPGVWSSEEEAQLLQVVKEANRKIGNDELSHEAPWEAVAAKMGYQRGPTQCRVKWCVTLCPSSLVSFFTRRATALMSQQA